MKKKKVKTIVVNRRNSEFDIYIGRGSIFGNPYKIGVDGNRKEVISKYRKWFYRRIKNPDFKRQVLILRGKKLGCYCKPLPCHGDVIVEFLEERKWGKRKA